LFQTLLFDLEGTLVDFQWNLQGAARDAKSELRRLDFDPSSWEDNYATLRNNAVLLAAQRGVANKHEVINCLDAIYDRYDKDAASRWSVLPSVKPVLSRLKREREIKMGLVSNIGRRAVNEALPRLELAEFFNVIITRNDVEMLKPNGEGIRNALAELGASHSKALFIGDSVTDVLSAREAGLQVAIVQGGESAPTSLVAAAPNFLWKSMSELETLYA
jgi:phosphoglycolate phosphatase